MFHTKLCDLLGITYPIIQGAMGGIGGPRLVAAVSNAGGLGVLAAWGISIDKLRDDIKETRSLTENPFAVNIMPLGPEFTESRARLVIEEGVGIVTTGRGDPRTPIVGLLHEHGIKVVPVVPTVRHALRVEVEGVDAIIASGTEAGGHVGTVATMPLIPQVVDAVKVPVVAAGGIGDARGFAAALALGACGIQMGTRFLVTNECQASLKQKQIIIDSSEENTIVSDLFTGKTVRFINTPVVQGFVRLARDGADRKDIPTLAAKTKGDVEATEDMITAAGQISGMVRSIESVADVINGIITEAEVICNRLYEVRGL